MLGSLCPHRAKLGDCPEPWCANRVADMELQGGLLPGRPGEASTFTVNGTVIRVAAITPFGVIINDRAVAHTDRPAAVTPTGGYR